MAELKESTFLDRLVDFPIVTKEAWKCFTEMGFPSSKTPSYQYVRLRDLYESTFHIPELPSKQNRRKALVFYNGSYCEALSTLPQGIFALTLSEAKRTYGNFLVPRLKKLLKEEKDPFATLNCALDQEGLFLYVPPKCKIEEPLSIVHVTDQPGALFSPKLHLFAAKDSYLEIFFCHERGAKESFSNAFFDFTVDERASVHMTHLEEGEWQCTSFNALRVSLKQESHFHVLSAAKKAKLSRQDFSICFEGERGGCSLSGVWKLDGNCQHHVHVLMKHEKPFCQSFQNFKGVNHDFSKSSFEGKIYVCKEALKTNAYQMNHNLILGERAFAYAKPNLEIFADDVKASHGATVGRIKEEDLFYLKTRGISQEQAKHLLIRGFLEEIVAKIRMPMRERALHLLDS